MFAKYLNQKQIRETRTGNAHDAHEGQALSLALRIDTLKAQLARAERELDDIRAKRLRVSVPYEPSFQLEECAAYLALCADLNRAPTCKDGIERMYQVTGAALSYALGDALYFEWIGKDGENKIYWKDAGLSDTCPMVVIAKAREDKRAARKAARK